MTYFDSSMTPQFRQRLASRAAELQLILRRQLAAAEQSDQHEVSDFKDAADQESLAAVGDVQAVHAAAELEQVFAAERRIAQGSFGRCIDCDEPIDLLRLTALPATPYCTACQSIHEQSAAHHGQPSHER